MADAWDFGPAPLPGPTVGQAAARETAPAGTAPPHADRDRPGRRRSRVGLSAQFALQFLYLPLGVLIGLGLIALVVWLNEAGQPGGGWAIEAPWLTHRLTATAISRRRLRVEWSGEPEAWSPYTDRLLEKRFAQAEVVGDWDPSELPPSGVRRAVADLASHYYRGLAPADVERLAERRGWSVDWTASRTPARWLRLFRLVPPPEQVGVPDPAGPPPAPGTPWGPVAGRVATPLLTFVFVSRLRTLELRRSPDAYLRHLRKYLTGLFRSELARDPGSSYLPDETGRILRRVTVGTWHFRGAGAAAALRLAAELGWQLDHSFPADPRRPLHLCRLDPTPR